MWRGGRVGGYLHFVHIMLRVRTRMYYGESHVAQQTAKWISFECVRFFHSPGRVPHYVGWLRPAAGVESTCVSSEIWTRFARERGVQVCPPECARFNCVRYVSIISHRFSTVVPLCLGLILRLWLSIVDHISNNQKAY